MKKLLFAFVALLVASSAFAQSSVTAGFSRGSPSAKDISVQAINDAKETLYIAAYQYTNLDIIRAVVAAKKRGVKVAVVLDKTQANGDSQATMVASGIDCRIDSRFKIMHHKFIVVDGKHVESGSFNFTLSADKANAENALYLKDVPDIAAKYKAQWDWVNTPATACKGGGQ